MGHGCAEGRFALGALAVKVNPLAVFGGLRKLTYAILGHFQPIGHADLPARKLFERARSFQGESTGTGVHEQGSMRYRHFTAGWEAESARVEFE